eukprot:1612471-Karenia_brevis.AAC.1
MCRWGMKQEDQDGEGYIRKETGWLTNCSELADLLEGECKNKHGETWHRHIHLMNGRAARAQIFPPKP